jgi:hypothetical protein
MPKIANEYKYKINFVALESNLNAFSLDIGFLGFKIVEKSA